MRLLSVIIPVFNAEKYLISCVESVCNQTYKNLEIILINDGSTDTSLMICEKLAAKDKRIKIISQTNIGSGVARNRGLDIAEGEFITFVDSDDYISCYMYETMLQYMKDDIDIIECDYKNVYSNEKFENNELDKNNVIEKYDNCQAMKEHLEDTRFRQIIWNKIYRKDRIQGIRFPEGKGIDDEFWTYQAIGNARKLGHINRVFYAYRQQNDSIMHNISCDDRKRMVLAKAERHQYIKRYYPELTAVSNKMLWITAIYCGQLTYLDHEIVDKKKEIIMIKNIMKQSLNRNDKVEMSRRKQDIWIRLAKINFSVTCRMRSILRIGL